MPKNDVPPVFGWPYSSGIPFCPILDHALVEKNLVVMLLVLTPPRVDDLIFIVFVVKVSFGVDDDADAISFNLVIEEKNASLQKKSFRPTKTVENGKEEEVEVVVVFLASALAARRPREEAEEEDIFLCLEKLEDFKTFVFSSTRERTQNHI